MQPAAKCYNQVQLPKVLVVDDDPNMIRLIAESLGKNYDILVARDGRACLKIIANQSVDLILLDVMMPDISGFELCQTIKDNVNTQDIPIIFVTSLEQEHDVAKGFNVGAVDFVSKPISAVILRARVRTHVTMKIQLDKMQVLATTDPLTLLANRRKFDETLQLEWKRCLRNTKPIAILMIDIDNFKAYNDNYGHGAGDECLTQVARTLQTSVARASDLVARLGGEEFAIILPDCDNKGAEKVAQRVINLLEQENIPHNFSDTCSHISVSIGICAQLPSVNTQAAKTCELADQALYQAKQQGKNQFKSADFHE
ncbi:diguanylate cyclase response regulator [Saccharobesus litoralis]|uniref:diguanylate cyclase n=1 Tax=Saccharobesus litoralis TaxID=2172099 RepID=A0A2S0VVR6_9ALTE|nr:diguanylate cyclase [Saccharobesus litoralis]AWB68273.1 diguanylate cyclase response regulator [Saccharobesus litoralis]